MADPATCLASNSVLWHLFPAEYILFIQLWDELMSVFVYCKLISDFEFLHQKPISSHTIITGSGFIQLIQT